MTNCCLLRPSNGTRFWKILLISIIDTNNSYRRSDQGTLYRSIPRSQTGHSVKPTIWPSVYCFISKTTTCCKQAYAGVSQSHSLLPVPVSLTRSGYPKIIPSFHRKMIMKKDQKADLWVHIYLSLVFVGLFAWRNGLTDRY